MSRTVRDGQAICAWCGRKITLGLSKRRNGQVWCNEYCGWRQSVRGRLRVVGKRPISKKDA